VTALLTKQIIESINKHIALPKTSRASSDQKEIKTYQKVGPDPFLLEIVYYQLAAPMEYIPINAMVSDNARSYSIRPGLRN
jgi:hypothetical protein